MTLIKSENAIFYAAVVDDVIVYRVKLPESTRFFSNILMVNILIGKYFCHEIKT